MQDFMEQGQPFERWNQPSPLKRIKVEGSLMDAEPNYEHTWSEESYRSQSPSGTMLAHRPAADAARTPVRRRPVPPTLDAAALLRVDGYEADAPPDSARSNDSTVSAESGRSSPRSNSSLSAMMRDVLTLDAASNDNESDKGSKKDDAKAKAKKKRVRRTATEIERNWRCDLCGKSYGSEGALKTHLKLKHPGVKIPKKEDIYGGSGPARYLPSQTAAMPFGTPGFMPSMKPDDPAARRAHSLPAPKRGGGRKAGSGPSPAMVSPELHPKYEDGSSGSGSVPSSPGFTPVTSPGGTTMHDEDRMNVGSQPGTVYIPGLMYQCGSYQRQSSFCGDLVLAINLSERKLAWDVFAVNSLLRMEISFDDIASMGIEPQSDTNGIVILNLHRPPTFFCGWSEPHTPTVWVRVNDFTGHQAVRFRHHVFCFLNTALTEPLNRLFDQEPALKKLADMGMSPDEALYFPEQLTQAAMNAVQAGQQQVLNASPKSPLSPMSPDSSSPYNTPNNNMNPEPPRSHYQAAPAPMPNLPRPTGNRIPLSQLNKAQRKQLLRPHHAAQAPSAYQQHYAPPPTAPFPSMDDDDDSAAMDTSPVDPFAASARSHSMPMRTDFLGNAFPQAPPAFGPNALPAPSFGGFSSTMYPNHHDMMGGSGFGMPGFHQEGTHQSSSSGGGGGGWATHSSADYMEGVDEGQNYSM